MFWVFSGQSGKNPRDFISAVGDITRGRLFQDTHFGKVSQLKVQWMTFSCFGGVLELTDWLETDFSFSRTLYQSLFFLSLAPSNEERS